MKNNFEIKQRLNKAKRHIKILYIALGIFFVITVFLLFGSTYICKGAAYEKIIDKTMGVEQEKYNQLFEVDDKITFANLAFGIENSKNANIVPVERDIRFLLLYISQIFAYLVLLLKLTKNNNIKFWCGIIASVLLISVAIGTITFMNGYQQDLQSIFDQSMSMLSSINKNITKIDDSLYPSKIDVSISAIPALSCGYMIISSFACIYITILEKFVSQNEVLNEKGNRKKKNNY